MEWFNEGHTALSVVGVVIAATCSITLVVSLKEEIKLWLKSINSVSAELDSDDLGGKDED